MAGEEIRKAAGEYTSDELRLICRTAGIDVSRGLTRQQLVEALIKFDVEPPPRVDYDITPWDGLEDALERYDEASGLNVSNPEEFEAAADGLAKAVRALRDWQWELGGGGPPPE